MKYILVAHWDNMSYKDFRESPQDYQELITAAYETNAQAESVKSWAERPRKSKK